jgi:uncharacterized protein
MVPDEAQRQPPGDEVAFHGTEAGRGFHRHWFDEFKPNYCTNAVNCGEKFFLLQSDGEVYSCAGQGPRPFALAISSPIPWRRCCDTGGSDQCRPPRSDWMGLPCLRDLSALSHRLPFVKRRTDASRSYTCQLQRRFTPTARPPIAAGIRHRAGRRRPGVHHRHPSPADVHRPAPVISGPGIRPTTWLTTRMPCRVSPPTRSSGAYSGSPW